VLPGFLTSRLSSPYIALSIFVRHCTNFSPRKTEVASLYNPEILLPTEGGFYPDNPEYPV
jgi:hypothetical protein